MAYQTAFISYRRQSSHAEAAFIHNSLRALGIDVFYDRDDLAAGDLWEARLNEELVNRDCLIVVLAPETLQESYWVPREVQVALTQNKKIIPVFTKGFTFSDAYVPDDIAGLKRYNGIRFDYDIADYAVGQITKVLEIKVTINVTAPPPAPEKQPNWIARFLSSQSWQGISAIIGIIGIIIAVIALNASNQPSSATTPSVTLTSITETSSPTYTSTTTNTLSITQTDTSRPTVTPTATNANQPPITTIPTIDNPATFDPNDLTCRLQLKQDLNVRSGPGTSYTRITALSGGTIATIIARMNDYSWWQIRYQGINGWLSGGENYIEVFGSCGDIAIISFPFEATSTPEG